MDQRREGKSERQNDSRSAPFDYDLKKNTSMHIKTVAVRGLLLKQEGSE